jgi:hypothetical protein
MTLPQGFRIYVKAIMWHVATMNREQASPAPLAFGGDLFGYPIHPQPVATCAAPLVALMHYPDALWLCRMGTPVEQALEQVKARDQSARLL